MLVVMLLLAVSVVSVDDMNYNLIFLMIERIGILDA